MDNLAGDLAQTAEAEDEVPADQDSPTPETPDAPEAADSEPAEEESAEELRARLKKAENDLKALRGLKFSQAEFDRKLDTVLELTKRLSSENRLFYDAYVSGETEKLERHIAEAKSEEERAAAQAKADEHWQGQIDEARQILNDSLKDIPKEVLEGPLFERVSSLWFEAKEKRDTRALLRVVVEARNAADAYRAEAAKASDAEAKAAEDEARKEKRAKDLDMHIGPTRAAVPDDAWKDRPSLQNIAAGLEKRRRG